MRKFGLLVQVRSAESRLLGGGAVALPPGCKHDGRLRGAGRAAGAAEGKVVCSSLELAQVLPPDTLPNRTVTL